MAAGVRGDFVAAERPVFVLVDAGGTLARGGVGAEERRAEELGIFDSTEHRGPVRIRDAAPQIRARTGSTFEGRASTSPRRAP